MSCMVAPSVLRLRESKFSGPRDSTALGLMYSLCVLAYVTCRGTHLPDARELGIDSRGLGGCSHDMI
jgi:hypothetical protein